MSYTVIKHTKRSLVERSTKIHLDDYDQTVTLTELYDDRNVCQRIFITDWASDDITSSLSKKLKDNLIELARDYHKLNK